MVAIQVIRARQPQKNQKASSSTSAADRLGHACASGLRTDRQPRPSIASIGESVRCLFGGRAPPTRVDCGAPGLDWRWEQLPWCRMGSIGTHMDVSTSIYWLGSGAIRCRSGLERTRPHPSFGIDSFLFCIFAFAGGRHLGGRARPSSSRDRNSHAHDFGRTFY